MKERESDILRTCMDGLAAKRIWAVRMNTATTILSYKGKHRAIRQGRKGMADILALPDHIAYPNTPVEARFKLIVWVECKTATGKQSPDQAAFQAEVEAEGHRYLLIRSWEELQSKL